MNSALVLVQTYRFRSGQLYLYQKLEMYHMIIQYYMEEGSYDTVIELSKNVYIIIINIFI